MGTFLRHSVVYDYVLPSFASKRLNNVVYVTTVQSCLSETEFV